MLELLECCLADAMGPLHVHASTFSTLTPQPSLALDDSKICHASLDFIVRQDAVLHFNKVVLAPYILSYKFRTVCSTAIQERSS